MDVHLCGLGWNFHFFPFWDESYLDCVFVSLKWINVLLHLLKLDFNSTISLLNSYLPLLVQATTPRWAFYDFVMVRLSVF